MVVRTARMSRPIRSDGRLADFESHSQLYRAGKVLQKRRRQRGLSLLRREHYGDLAMCHERGKCEFALNDAIPIEGSGGISYSLCGRLEIIIRLDFKLHRFELLIGGGSIETL